MSIKIDVDEKLIYISGIVVLEDLLNVLEIIGEECDDWLVFPDFEFSES